MHKLIMAASLVALLGSPALAQSRPQFGPLDGGARASAIKQCSGVARAYSEPTWGDMQMQQYRACMAEHGQPA